jgi:hypothetical protein
MDEIFVSVHSLSDALAGLGYWMIVGIRSADGRVACLLVAGRSVNPAG